MHSPFLRLGALRLLMATLMVFLAVGCSGTRYGFPYKISVQQGNVITKEQVSLLRPGMTRDQVAEIMGTSLLMSVFHADRWDYVFTFKKPGSDLVERKLTVYFKENSMDRFEGDPMPTEVEFVNSIAN